MAELVAPYLAHMQFGMVREIPKHAGDSILWRRVERVAEPPEPPAVTSICVPIRQYGAYRLMDEEDRASLKADPDRFLGDAAEGCAEMAGISADTIVRETLIEGCEHIIRAGGAKDRRAVNKYLTLQLLLQGRAALERADARPIDFGNGKHLYAVILHPDSEADLMQDPEFIETLSFAGPRDDSSAIICGGLPDTHGMRFFAASNASCLGRTYQTLMLGAYAYGATAIADDQIQFIYKPPFDPAFGPATPTDEVPLDGNLFPGSVGVKFALGVGVLNTDFMVCLEHITRNSDRKDEERTFAEKILPFKDLGVAGPLR